MVSARESEKALRYISQLDDARCAGRWKDISELCRKVEKHAPHRQCLTLTARSEAQIATYSSQRPSTTASTASSGLSKIIPSLLTAVEEEGDDPQDAFQATVCLGWLHYVLDEPGLAVARLPKDFSAVALNLSNKETTLRSWTQVCIIKGAYIKGSSQERTASVEEAAASYRSVLQWLSSSKPSGSTTHQFKIWTELLVVRSCLLSDQSNEIGTYIDTEDALQSYRFWAKYCETSGHGSEGPIAAKNRRLAWKAYYNTLSVILQHGLPYSPALTGENQDTSANEKSSFRSQSYTRLQQRAEFKRIETIYEGLLLKETRFPKASESNQEVEIWTDAVMQNWRILCGPNWRDEDLGEGGKEGVGRGVLDILYRAAMQTFHSTQILRHLFTVHASLAEFDLAFKAYDSYVEIVTRGKDRAEKSGEEDVGIDDDNTILRTSAEAIRVLCRFGSRKEAEKALNIGQHMEKWLEQTQHIKESDNRESQASPKLNIAPRALSVAFCAIGISLAHWARFTYIAEARTSIHTKAVQYLRKSLEPRFEEPNNIEALYALGLVLAEMRDIPGAIKVVKRALSPATKSKSAISADGVISGGLSTEYGRERKLIPVWHLLSLLLTSRSEYTTAERSCEAAFEQFGDPLVLFGNEAEDKAYRSEHLNDIQGSSENTSSTKATGIVDQMEAFERSGILQVKLTQLALVEVIDGSNAAVDGCDELLALYARLFGDPAAEKAELQPPVTAKPPPKSSAGTIRGSLFLSKSKSVSQRNSTARTSSVASSRPSTIATTTTGTTPAIQITDEDSISQSNGGHHLFHHNHEASSTPKRTSSKLQKRSANSLRRKSEVDADDIPEVPDIEATLNGTPIRPNSVRETHSRRPSTAGSLRKSVEKERPLRTIPHNMSPASEPPPPGHAQQPPKQDVRMPTPFPRFNYISPDPRFSKLQERRHKVSLLVNIWVFISRLYTRAEMFEDAHGSVKEAIKLVESFEAEIAQESSSSKAFADRGWGGGKSVEELWGDVFAARGEILVAESRKHEARADFERAVLHFPDHSEAIVGLSNILLDIYCKVIPLEPSKDSLTTSSTVSSPSVPTVSENVAEKRKKRLSTHTPSAENQVSPPELNRLAARDRAHGLLSTLTKLGSGWDYSEAWYTLARAYEESGQIDKTKEVLWWCVELEDTHPIRSWRSVAFGGFVL